MDHATLSFDFDAPTIQPVPQPQPEPVWEFRHLPHVDFLADEYVWAMCFDVAELEARSPGIYISPLIKCLLHAFHELSVHPKKSLREQSFTTYYGNAANYFVIANNAKEAAIIDFICERLKEVPGYVMGESGVSTQFMPAYRYDKGHVIQYTDEGDANRVYTDDEAYYGSGVTLRTREWQPADQIGKNKSVYGKLIPPSVTP